MIGVYLTDASFDAKTKTSSISFLESESGSTGNIQTNEFENIYQAELAGIKACIKDALDKYSDIVIFCDNQRAVFNSKRDFNILKRFKTAQVVWLPRKFLDKADFLTKNVDDLELNKITKIDGFESKLGNVFDIFIGTSDIDDLFQKFTKNIDMDSFKSKTFQISFSEGRVEKKFFLEETALIKDDILNIIEKYPEEGRNNSNMQKALGLFYH